MSEFEGQVRTVEPTPGARRDNAGMAVRMHRLSLDRANMFQTDAIRNPEWEILLSLFIANNEGLRMPFASLCAANRLSRGIAERAVDALAVATLAEWRRGGSAPADRHVELTASGKSKVNQFLQRVATSA